MPGNPSVATHHYCHVDCTQCKEALSARLDGEDSEAERDALDVHLASCAACHRFADDAARVNRLARTAVAAAVPDLVEAVLAKTIDTAIGTGDDGLPPDLRPTAQYDDTALAHRRTA